MPEDAVGQVVQSSRALFKCLSVKFQEFGQSVELAAVYDTRIPEHQRYAQASPSGKMEIYITNPALNGFYVPGKYYYLDSTPADAPK